MKDEDCSNPHLFPTYSTLFPPSSVKGSMISIVCKVYHKRDSISDISKTSLIFIFPGDIQDSSATITHTQSS